MSGAARHSEEPRFPAAASEALGTAATPEDGRQRVFIEAIAPVVDGGEYAVKRTLGDTVTVSADLVADGHDVLAGEVLVRRPDQPEPYLVVPLELQANQRYSARFDVDTLGLWQYTLQAWVDGFASWRRGLSRKLEAKQDVHVELLEGAALVSSAARSARGRDRESLEQAARQLARTDLSSDQRAQAALAPELSALMAAHPDRSRAKRIERWLPIWVDRERARFGAWYEMFPRSTGPEGKHGTFETSRALLPYIAGLGFDILYLPPIHPIGTTFRKGKNNQPSAMPGDVGSPWAIGGSAGGHKAVHPELGTLEDFDRFASAAREHGLELALDIALQVTPDHPYVKEHPEWFKRRPDGSIQYAENPPKKYQDIYPFDFDSEAWWSLWIELRSIFEFWMDRGVRIFRVDNPHTKPLRFWHWCIAELRRKDPNLIFL
ncbi:MAG TPA: maltotransferase domain-containing protein, partial [Polyangiaceae bacterium]|nr:maltotransferase domain-containing protein [Polyangiaceae bacterium]